MKTALQIDITFDQILSLVKQLPEEQIIKLTEELKKDIVDSKLSQLLKTFKTDELNIEEIYAEVEDVRQELYEKRKV